MRFVETQKGIWIPEGTTLEDHAPKTRNYALLHDLDVQGVVTLDALVSLPPADPKLNSECPLLYRVDYVEEILAAIFSDSRIPFTPDDYLVRSALTFEDTVATRAAGIGDSRRFQKSMTAETREGLLCSVLGYELNPDIRAYTEKHGISGFSLGLQICPTVVYEDGEVAYSGSAKLLAEDFIEITVNEGHSFEGMQNKVPAFRYYFEREIGKWRKKFERKDDFRKDLDDDLFMELLARPLLKALFALKKRGDFPEGLEVEYVKETQVSPLTLVQYAPIPYLPKETFQEGTFIYRNDDPDLYMHLIIGCGEKYFPPTNIFILENQTPSKERACALALQEFNKHGSKGYLLIDTRDSDNGQIGQFPYPEICNATAFLHPYSHINLLSDHMCNIAREHGTLVAAPFRWKTRDSHAFRSIPDFELNALRKGISLRVNERTQECFVAYGNIWEKQ